jgi:titin
VTSYNVYRGTALGAESATPVATGLTGTTFADTSLTSGTKYWYEVAAVNATGQGTVSLEASATTLQPSIVLAVASGGSASATVTAGQMATYQLVLTPANYAGKITFTCTGAPAADTCTVPAPLSVTASSGTAQVTISVQTSSAQATERKNLLPGSLALFAGFLAPLILIRKKRIGGLVTILAAAALLAAASGCGSGSSGGGGGSNAPVGPVVSTLTVTASGTGVVAATQLLTLTVE